MQKLNAEPNLNTLLVGGLELYMEIAEKMGVRPNFWLSREYLQKAKITFHSSKGWIWAEDDGVVVFPPLHPGFPSKPPAEVQGYWSDFGNNTLEKWFEPGELLDQEYIYDPEAFLDLSGGKWSVFRKNTKKWPEGHIGNNLYCIITPGLMVLEINHLLVKWLGTLSDYEIHDSEVMIDYAFTGENRKALFNPQGKLVGLNIWDENWEYINFRYCLSLPEDNLNAYMRLLFYSDPDIINKKKLVNDGGTLGRDSLKFFKDKMNPLRVRPVHSHNLKQRSKTNEV